MATSDIASKAAKFREMAKDKALPQDVRNAYLDKANKLEEATMKPTMAKGGAVVAKAPKSPMKSMPKGPAVVIAVGMAKKPAKMNYGGMAAKQPMMSKGGAVKPMAKKGK